VSGSYNTAHPVNYTLYSEIQGDTVMAINTNLEAPAGQTSTIKLKSYQIDRKDIPTTIKNATTFNVSSYGVSNIYPIGTRVIIRAVE
jgi:hypothetical protein